MKPKDILLSNTANKGVTISVFFQNDTFWLTQKAMVELFGVNVTTVNKHLKTFLQLKNSKKFNYFHFGNNCY